MDRHLGRIKEPREMRDEISESEYERLLKEHFADAKESFSSYCYFDTSTDPAAAALYQKHVRLRVKMASGQTVFQLKRKGGEMTEIHQELTKEQFTALLDGEVPQGAVAEKLEEWGLMGQLHMIGGTETVRHKKVLLGGDAQIEKTTYGDGTTTYQVEYRSTTKNGAEVRQLLRLGATITAKSKLEHVFSNVRST